MGSLSGRGLSPGGSLSRKGSLSRGVSVRETPHVRLRAGSTHPTRMHSRSSIFYHFFQWFLMFCFSLAEDLIHFCK